MIRTIIFSLLIVVSLPFSGWGIDSSGKNDQNHFLPTGEFKVDQFMRASDRPKKVQIKDLISSGLINAAPPLLPAIKSAISPALLDIKEGNLYCAVCKNKGKYGKFGDILSCVFFLQNQITPNSIKAKERREIREFRGTWENIGGLKAYSFFDTLRGTLGTIVFWKHSPPSCEIISLGETM